MSYRDIILQRLIALHQKESQFHELIANNNKLLQRTIDLEKRNKQLESDKQTEVDSKAQGSSKRVAELDQRIRELNEERAEMYKTHSENAQRLVTLNERLRMREEKDKRQTEENKVLTEQVKKLTSQTDLQAQLLKEKDKAIEVLQDEYQVTHLENITISAKNTKLTSENAELLQRWINKKNEEAEKMNEATRFYETALEQRRTEADRKKSSSRSNKAELSESIVYSTILLPNKASKKINVHDSDIHCIASSTLGNMFATGGADKKIKLYDPKTGNVTATLRGSLQTITSVSFNSTDQLLLGSCTDNATRIWDLTTNRFKTALTGHIGQVQSAKFNADSTRVVSGSHDRTLKVWDITRGANLRTIFTFSMCNDLCLADPDGHTLISGHLDGNIRLWDTRTGNGIRDLTGVHMGQVTSVCLSPDGTSVLTNSRDNTLKIIDLRNYDILKTFHADTYQNGLNWSRASFSPDGQYVSAGSKDGSLHIWNTKSRKVEKCIKEHSSVICGVSWSPTADYLFSAEKNKAVCIWETSSIV